MSYSCWDDAGTLCSAEQMVCGMETQVYAHMNESCDTYESCHISVGVTRATSAVLSKWFVIWKSKCTLESRDTHECRCAEPMVGDMKSQTYAYTFAYLGHHSFIQMT